MVVKQALVKCVCGQAMQFPDGQIKTRCECGTVWELSLDGLWEICKVPFVTFLMISRRSDLNHYHRYMLWRYKGGRR